MTASANLELVRSIFEAWERGDFSSFEWAHPEIEFVMIGGPEPSTWNGLAELEAFVREFMSAWEELRIYAEEYRELDDERVFVPARSSGRGKTSGVEVGRARGCYVFHIRSGKVTRQVFYWDSERALADLGLSPQGDAADPPV